MEMGDTGMITMGRVFILLYDHTLVHDLQISVNFLEP
jgi:hypothetical protein